MMTAQQDFRTQFISGLLPREDNRPKLGYSIDKVSTVLTSGEKEVIVKVGQPTYTGEKGEKQYKLILEEFSEGMVLLRTVDISHGVGHVVIRKQYIETKEKEITTTI